MFRASAGRKPLAAIFFGLGSCTALWSVPTLLAKTEEVNYLSKEVMDQLKAIVGASNVVYNPTGASVVGMRIGKGPAAALVTPNTILECVAAIATITRSGGVVIPQGANTSLTGGAVPRKDPSGRPCVIVSSRNMSGVAIVDRNTKPRLLCMAGSGLQDLDAAAASVGVESHSTLGSQFLNPRASSGVAFGSGGTQARKGPAHTDRALYVRVAPNGAVEVVNTLHVAAESNVSDLSKPVQPGLPVQVPAPPAVVHPPTSQADSNGPTDLGGLPPQLASALDGVVFVGGAARLSPVLETERAFKAAGVAPTLVSGLPCDAAGSHTAPPVASWTTYLQHIADAVASKSKTTVARCNADAHGLEVNRCEGKCFILATVHDTFPRPVRKRMYWVASRDFGSLAQLRKDVLLHTGPYPLMCEYMNDAAFDTVDSSGRVLTTVMRLCSAVGSQTPMVLGMRFKNMLDSKSLTSGLIDKFFARANGLMPEPLEAPIMALRRRDGYAHHMVVEVGEFSDSAAAGEPSLDDFERRLSAYVTSTAKADGAVPSVALHRVAKPALVVGFRATAAAAFKTACVGAGWTGLSYDYAMPVNGVDAIPEQAATVADGSSNAPTLRMLYAHFMCNVIHEDVAFAQRLKDAKTTMYAYKQVVDAAGGRLPAEHGHGIEYAAPLWLTQRWRDLDPLNVFNPGIGHTPAGRAWTPVDTL